MNCRRLMRTPPAKSYHVIDSPSPSPQYEPSDKSIVAQTADDALSPFPFYVLEPHHSGFCCSVVDNNRTPREPAMPVRSLHWATRRHFLTTTGLGFRRHRHQYQRPRPCQAMLVMITVATSIMRMVGFMLPRCTLPRCTLPRCATGHKLGSQT
jgi:hypothetical protein